MKKILVLSSFPASYRVDVFKGLMKKYKLTVLFGTDENENRNPDWFVKNGELKYYLVNRKDGSIVAKECYKNLKKFDLILGYDWYATWALKFELKAMLLNIPYIVNCDGAFIRKSFLKDIVKRLLVSKAAACFAGGEYARQYFLHYGAKAKKIYIHHFTSLHKENILKTICTEEDKQRLRKALGLSDKKVVLSIGQFVYRKGFDILLNAWAGLDRKDAQLVIVGGGDLRFEYERLIDEQYIENVTIIDFVPFNEIFKYYMAADVFALATREDIWGLIVNEAMANGIPVLISDKCIAGLELVENGKTGFIIENNEIQNWVERLEKVLNDIDLRQNMGKAGLAKIHNWTIENIVKSHLEILDRVIE